MNCHKKTAFVPWLLVFVTALAVRLVYLRDIDNLIYFDHLVGDAKGYDAWARQLIEQNWRWDESYYQAPLYPYYLACVYSVLGRNLWLARVAQCALGSLACVAVGLAGERFVSRRAGVIAGLIAAVYPPAIYFDGILQKESLAFALTVCLILTIGSAMRRDRRWKCVIAGVVLGLLALTRENALALVPVVLVWIVVRRPVAGRRRAFGAAAFVVGFVATVLPAALHNHRTGGSLALTTFQTGPNFYMGNHADADGRYSPLIPGRETFEFERADATALARRETGKSLSAREVSDYWMDRAIGYVKSQPLHWLRLTWHKWGLVWNRYEIPDTESYYIYRDASPLLGAMGRVMHFGVLCPLAVSGVVLTWSRRRELWILYALAMVFAASVAAFYVFGRYRFPLAAILAVFAGGGIVEFVESVRSRGWKRLSVAVATASIAAFWVNRPINPESKLDSAQLGNLGAALAENGRLDEALDVFHRAAATYPEAPRLRQFLGDALSLKGQYDKAIPHYEAALAMEPGRMNAEFNLAVALERVGRVNEAIAMYERAAAANPDDIEAGNAARRLRDRR